ncbi:MAG TPA: circularly permuted type 2 ATP-grasp protein [Bryobacteraceae bacterium]|nr:circularly permuted type 2 ATP-grasp protein [Bryobacteraceae bacterium]
MTRKLSAPRSHLDPVWSYEATPGFYDEVLGQDKQLRPHWRALAESLANIGHAGVERRWREGQRLIHDNGITYNVYSDPESTSRPWPLDPVPLMMDPAEWKTIEAAVIQRATLFNSILADLYGPQRLLRDKMLPAELVFPNPAFLRPCWGIQPPGGVFLHMYAADLARSPDGQWWVLADRTQSPSGAGYALENRLVTNRVLPDVFRASHIRRVSNFFQTYRDALQRLVPANRENPRIVLLTPGPYNETYFEHAFLARYLGYTLVEGGDLTVRDNRVYMKTLGGLLPVDVIVRRQDDQFCDPLELRADSMLGVPALVQAVRSGNVAIANTLGSGLAESPAYAAFLPGLSRLLLNEDLKIPTVATWWCGQQEPLEYVLDHLTNLVLKPTFPGLRGDPIFGAALSGKEREALLDKVRAEPDRYVAQERVALSTVPVWEDGPLHPRHMVVRVYAVSSGGSYAVMPGGLTRVSTSLDSMVVSIQRGGGSKDTWVLGDGPAPPFTLLRPATHPLDVSRATFDLSSRIADNLFWLGRYTERVEAAVRITRAILSRFFQEEDAARAAGLNAGLEILTALGYINGEEPSATEHEVLAMIYDPAAANGLVWNIHQVRRVAWLLRDRISVDAWLILNQLDQQFSMPPPAEEFRVSAAQDRLNRAVITLSAFGGLVMESMTRGDGWRFLDIGRRLERALQMAELLRNGLPRDAAGGAGVLEAILEMADSSITYRSRYLTSVQTDLVLDLLLVDEANPRSIAFQLARLREHIAELPNSKTSIRRPPEERAALSLLNTVQLLDVRELARSNGHTAAEARDALLGKLITDLTLLSDALTRAYFSHAAQSRRL